VLYGVNLASAGVVVWDRWAQDNHNSVVLARSGAGKSYLMKLDVLRNLYQGVQVAVVDPEDEYVRLAQRVGGTVVQLGASGVRLNPLDIPAADRRPDALTRRALFLHTVVAVLAGTGTGGGDAALSAPQTAALDAIVYHASGHQTGIPANGVGQPTVNRPASSVVKATLYPTRIGNTSGTPRPWPGPAVQPFADRCPHPAVELLRLSTGGLGRRQRLRDQSLLPRTVAANN
jgi:hypothetical protein